MAHPLSDIAISEIKNLIFFHILFIILVLTFFLKKNMREKKNQHVSCCSSEAVVKFNGCMWTDEGYGPTWDSDDEYDNFIRKMNPPRCIHVLLCSCLSQFWEITISYCYYVINSRFFILLVSFINCRIEIDNDSCNDATIVRVMALLFFLSE